MMQTHKTSTEIKAELSQKDVTVITFWTFLYKRTKKIHTQLLFWCILIIASILRFAQFPSLPAGLNQDEASAAYESYALLTRGTDRWGNKFPIYFPSWGSGQNVLQSYLNIPFIKLFGLNTFGARFLPTLLSVLTLIVLYLLVKKLYNAQTGLLAMLLLSITPWHIMLSRWSLEANLLPFFLLTSVASLVYCYTSSAKKALLPFSLVFLALSCYAYAVAILIIPGIAGLYFLIRHKTILTHKTSFLLSLGLFLFLAGPFLLFILDNNILHYTPPFITHLPLTIPLLIANRFNQVNSGQNILTTNIHFLTSGFCDGVPWNNLDSFQPLGFVALPGAALGVYYSLKKYGDATIFVIWLIATLPLFFLMPLNINHANAIFVPLVALSAIGIGGMYSDIGHKKTKRILLIAVLAMTLSYSGLFCNEYFTNYNNDISSPFNDGLDQALLTAKTQTAPGEPTYLSDNINLNYVYLLYFFRIDAHDFQQHSSVVIDGNIYKVLNYRNYYFYPEEKQLTSAPSYIAILKGDEQINCQSHQVLYSQGIWTVERCNNR